MKIVELCLNTEIRMIFRIIFEGVNQWVYLIYFLLVLFFLEEEGVFL